jgi:hypothetical protein
MKSSGSSHECDPDATMRMRSSPGSGVGSAISEISNTRPAPGPAVRTTLRASENTVAEFGTRLCQKSDRFPASVFNCVTSSRALRASGPAPAEPSGLNSKIMSFVES